MPKNKFKTASKYPPSSKSAIHATTKYIIISYHLWIIACTWHHLLCKFQLFEEKNKNGEGGFQQIQTPKTNKITRKMKKQIDNQIQAQKHRNWEIRACGKKKCPLEKEHPPSRWLLPLGEEDPTCHEKQTFSWAANGKKRNRRNVRTRKDRKEKRENPRNRQDLDLSPFDGVPAARALHVSASENFVISIERDAKEELKEGKVWEDNIKMTLALRRRAFSFPRSPNATNVKKQKSAFLFINHYMRFKNQSKWLGPTPQPLVHSKSSMWV